MFPEICYRCGQPVDCVKGTCNCPEGPLIKKPDPLDPLDLERITRENKEREAKRKKEFARFLSQKLKVIKEELDETVEALKREGYLSAAFGNTPTQSMIDLMNFQKQLSSIITKFEDKSGEEECICTKECDCQNSPLDDDKEECGAIVISNECPVHNDNPNPNPECPIHGYIDC